MAEVVNGRGQYRRGVRFEHETLADLEANGYFAVRTPGSKGVADIVAVKVGQVLFVQCKISGSLPPAPWNGLYDTAMTFGAVPVLAERPGAHVVRYWRLDTRKDAGRRVQPRSPFVVDEPGQAPARRTMEG